MSTVTLMNPPVAGPRLALMPQPPPNLFGLRGAEGGGGGAGKLIYSLLGTAALGALTYHGYKRNDDSLGWGLAWGLLGGLVWPITVPVALAQGFGKPKKS
jgi:hypothetical protein